MSTLRWLHGDVRDRLADIPDQSVDLIVTSPPFLALRSYLPADHPDKHREIGSEPTPADFLDTLLGLTAEWGRVLAPHGSICVELGDTYSGSGGAGGDYGPVGLRAGQNLFDGSAKRERTRGGDERGSRRLNLGDGPPKRDIGPGWPPAKSLTGIPTLYTWSLAYGRNLLRQPLSARELAQACRMHVDLMHENGYDISAAELLEWIDNYIWSHEAIGACLEFDPWRIRNVIVWGRPNPPVGALGDKFRPATSYITVAGRSQRRWFDLDAVRVDSVRGPRPNEINGTGNNRKAGDPRNPSIRQTISNPEWSGAPPLDWHQDVDGDWLWKLATAPYPGAHYATYPLTLPLRLIEAMCPREVCRVCGKARERVTAAANGKADSRERNSHSAQPVGAHITAAQYETLGWTDCGCLREWEMVHGHNYGYDRSAYPPDAPIWRPGRVLDPFAGSGTTLTAAALSDRDAIGIDLDSRNLELASQRISGQVRIVTGMDDEHGVTWTTERVTAAQLAADARGQGELFAS